MKCSCDAIIVHMRFIGFDSYIFLRNAIYFVSLLSNSLSLRLFHFEIDADAAAEVSRAEDTHHDPPSSSSSISSPPASPERRRKSSQGATSLSSGKKSKAEGAMLDEDDCADIPVGARTVGNATVVDTVRHGEGTLLLTEGCEDDLSTAYSCLE